jgi:SNF2 family DNA or RNA helicase
MTPYDVVKEAFEFPFELYPFQVKETNILAVNDRAGFWWEPGAGKTAGSTHWALYMSLTQDVNHWVVVMPPILLNQWARWLAKIKSKATGPLTTTVYAGTPKKRATLNLDVDFVLMSYVVFKNDSAKLTEFFSRRKVGVICDEAHAIKNTGSDNHKYVRDFSAGRPLALLTGTPLTTPADAYAYIKLLAPGIYRNRRQFESLHVGARDDYDRVTVWINLDLLAENMKANASRVLRREVNKELPKVIYSTIFYDLDPAHLKLYNRIAQEKLVEFEDGREINAISAQAAYSATQQVILNWAEFEDDESKRPAALDIIDEIFEEIGPTAKLAVVANFIRSNTYLLGQLKKYGVVAVYGEVTPANKQKAIAKFIDDPSCRCILLQPQSAGFGVDGLQAVCSDMLVLEAPTTAPPFGQVVARLDRDGQTSPVNCRIAAANGTIQVKMFKRLLDNDAQINSVQVGYQDLKEAIYGK